MVKVDDPTDIQGAHERSFNELSHAERASNQDYANAGIDQAEAFANDPENATDYGREARDRETTSDGWKNNVTGEDQGPKGWRGAGKKAVGIFKKKGATAAILALLGIGGAVPFLGASSLPFSIVGNMDSNSMMQGLQQYSEDYIGFNIFKPGTKATVGTTADKIRGLRTSEITQLEKNGVKLNGATKTATGKFTFDSVTFEGRTYGAGTEFKTAMRNNTAFRKAMVYTRGSYWKSSKSAFGSAVKKLFKINPNPDISGKDDKAKAKSLTSDALGEDTESKAKATGGSSDAEEGSNAAKEEAEAKNVARETTERIDQQATDVREGKVGQAAAKAASNANITEAMGRDGADLIGGGLKGLGGKIWGTVNILDPIDMLCTVYNVASTANTVARTVALANIVRFAMTIRTVIERAKAGDDNGEDVKYLMTMLQNKDPTTGQSFDETSYASMLFSGKLSSEPSAVSAVGGQAMVALMMTMHSINAVAGQLTTFGIDAGQSKALTGRIFLKSACKITQNIGVQIGATIGTLALSFFTGGTVGAAGVAAKTAITQGMKAALKKVGETLTAKALRDLTKKTLEEQGVKATAAAVSKQLAKNSWKGFMKVWGGLSGWNKVGLLVVGASTFGMSYIIDALSGTNIAGLTENGFAAFDALGTGWNQYESSNAIASGGIVANYAQATAYQQTQNEYTQSYIADAKYDAKDTPFDLTTPYSALGTALLSVQKTIGISASLSLPSTIMSVMSLPFKLPTMMTASADAKPTPEAIGKQIGYEYQDDNGDTVKDFYSQNQIATTVTGSPEVIFQKTYSFEDVLDKLVDGTNPQMTYEGSDPTTGEPILNIIEGSDLAKYKDTCHNPDKTELDEEYATDGAEGNRYDTSTCMRGGSNYKDVYALYDDAIRYIGQVSPDATTSTSSNSANGSTTSSSSSSADVGDGDDVPAEFKSIAQKCLAATGKACVGSNSWLGTLPGQCASFAAWRAVQQWYGSKLNADGSNLATLLKTDPLPGGHNLAFGNGNQVATNLINLGMADPVKYSDLQPGDIVSVNSPPVGSFPGNSAGHVFVIKSVNGSDITIEDYNLAGGAGKYGTAKASSLYIYQKDVVVAIARVHKGGGE